MKTELELTGLQLPVMVDIDEYGVSHIFADNEHDLFMAQGYMTVRDRLVQMELTRRRGKGRLAEIMGPKYFASDWKSLTLGILRTAQAQLEQYKANKSPMLDVLQSYASGANVWIEHASSHGLLPDFFKDMGYKPEPWTILDSLVMQGMVTEDLAFQMGQLERFTLSEKLGKEMINSIMPEFHNNPQTPWAPGPYCQDAPVDKQALLDALLPYGPGQGVGGLVDDQGPKSQGYQAVPCAKPTGQGRWSSASLPESSDPDLGNSNNWVIGGALTDTGKPYLAGDPHLGLTIPSVWHEVHLHCPTINVYGVIFPGIPGVMIGHNDQVAWSPTNGQNIQVFYYIEKTDPDRPGQYFHNGKWVDFGNYDVTIPVRGKAPKRVSIPWTVHGPVINRHLPKVPPMPDGVTVSMAYTGNLYSDLMRAVYELDRSRNADDVKQALSHWGSPVQNFAYATADGDFGIISAGYFPILLSGKPWEMLPGTGEADWAGLIPRDRTPQIHNPKWGYATSSNERQVGPDYPYTIGSSDNRFCAGWRSRTINAFLKDPANHPLRMESIASLQTCNRDSLAESIVPVLIGVVRNAPPISREALQAADILEEWDYVMRKEQPAPAIWDTFIVCYFTNLFGPWWKWSGLADLKEYSFDQIHLSSAGWKGALLASVESLSTLPAGSKEITKTASPNDSLPSWFYDPILDQERTREEIMLLSLIDAIGILSKKLGSDMTAWEWGELHHRLIPSLLDKKELQRGPYPTDGNGRVPNAAGGAEPAIHGPSWRMIVSLTNPVESWGVYPGGQSEEPTSPHYDDQFMLWADCQYKKLHFPSQPQSGPGGHIVESIVISPV